MPRRIRLVNESPDTVDVWIDRCFWHTRLATIPPGRALQPRLPERLVAFPEGLRFHAHAVRDPVEYLGVFTLPLDDVPVLELVVSERTRANPDSLHQFVLDDSVRVGGGAVIEGTDDAGGYTALFARSSSAILSWACGVGGRRYLTLNLSGRIGGDEASVRMRLDGGAWEPLGRWRVQGTGPSDAVVSPDDRTESLTRRVLASGEVAFVVTPDSGSRQAHAFELEGLADALAGRACWRGVVESVGAGPPD